MYIKNIILISISLWCNSNILCVIEQHQLECALLGLGQFQNNFDELHAWISHTAELLQASRPISIDLQTCEIELAKHKVFAPYTDALLKNLLYCQHYTVLNRNIIIP